jgi:hypothetical protein
MRKVIASMNMTIDGFCDHTAMIADDEIHQYYNDLLNSADTILYGIPQDIDEEISRRLSMFEEKSVWAVRSSATAEDLPTASFAGQQDTYLNITGWHIFFWPFHANLVHFNKANGLTVRCIKP